MKKNIIDKIKRLKSIVVKDEWEVRRDILKSDFKINSKKKLKEFLGTCDMYMDDYQSIAWADGYCRAMDEVLELITSL